MKEMDVVCGAIQIDDKFLIARRSKGADPGFWEFPGGKVEQNENREEALIIRINNQSSGLEVCKRFKVQFNSRFKITGSRG